MDTYIKDIKTENNDNTSCIINKKSSHIGKNKAGKNSSLEGYSKADKVSYKGASAGSETLKAYLWSAPSLTLICLIVIFPILYTAYISMTNMNVYHWTNFTFVGLKNYMDALLVFDNGFISALIMTVVWTVVSMVFQLVIAFILASLLNVKGAVTFGLVNRILQVETLRNLFRIDADSVILLINTEGDTDPEGYRKIVYGNISVKQS